MERLKKINSICNIITIALLILYLNIGTAILIFFKLSYLEFSYGLYIFGTLALIQYIVFKILNKERIILKDLFILLLIFFLIISYLFAYRKNDALFGVITRNEGLFSLVSYYTLYLLASTINVKSQRKLLNIFLFTGFIQIIIGVMQTMQITNILGYDRSLNWSTNFKFASGTLGNPNFYSTYILMCTLYSQGRLLEKKSLGWIIIFLIFVSGLIIGNTTSCMIAFILCFFAVLIKKINKKNIKKVFFTLVISSVVIICSLSFFDKFVNHRISYTMNKNINEIREIFKNGITDSTGNYRVYIWRNTISKIPEYFLTGIGIDNFSYINDGHYLCAGDKKYQCFDKAHNEYLQILITDGVITFLIYISFIIYILITSKNCLKGTKFAVYGYLIQALFNISVIQVAPIFYVLLGFMSYKSKLGTEVTHE